MPLPTDPGWIQVGKVIGVSPSGGDDRYKTRSPLGSYVDRQTPDGRSLPSLQVIYQDAPDSAHHQAIVTARDALQSLAWMIRLRSGSVIMFVGHPGGSLLPSIARNQLLAVTVNIATTVAPQRMPA